MNFDYDTVPTLEDIAPQVGDLAARNCDVLMRALTSDPEFLDVRAAYLYDRKGYVSMDTIDGPRNTAYGSLTDDVVISVTVRLSARELNELDPCLLADATAAYDERVEQQKTAAIAAREAEIARLQAEVDAMHAA
jgi:hypothetical protein